MSYSHGASPFFRSFVTFSNQRRKSKFEQMAERRFSTNSVQDYGSRRRASFIAMGGPVEEEPKPASIGVKKVSNATKKRRESRSGIPEPRQSLSGIPSKLSGLKKAVSTAKRTNGENTNSLNAISEGQGEREKDSFQNGRAVVSKLRAPETKGRRATVAAAPSSSSSSSSSRIPFQKKKNSRTTSRRLSVSYETNSTSSASHSRMSSFERRKMYGNTLVASAAPEPERTTTTTNTTALATRRKKSVEVERKTKKAEKEGEEKPKKKSVFGRMMSKLRGGAKKKKEEEKKEKRPTSKKETLPASSLPLSCTSTPSNDGEKKGEKRRFVGPSSMKKKSGLMAPKQTDISGILSVISGSSPAKRASQVPPSPSSPSVAFSPFDSRKHGGKDPIVHAYQQYKGQGAVATKANRRLSSVSHSPIAMSHFRDSSSEFDDILDGPSLSPSKPVQSSSVSRMGEKRSDEREEQGENDTSNSDAGQRAYSTLRLPSAMMITPKHNHFVSRTRGLSNSSPVHSDPIKEEEEEREKEQQRTPLASPAHSLILEPGTDVTLSSGASSPVGVNDKHKVGERTESLVFPSEDTESCDLIMDEPSILEYYDGDTDKDDGEDEEDDDEEEDEAKEKKNLSLSLTPSRDAAGATTTPPRAIAQKSDEEVTSMPPSLTGTPTRTPESSSSRSSSVVKELDFSFSSEDNDNEKESEKKPSTKGNLSIPTPTSTSSTSKITKTPVASLRARVQAARAAATPVRPAVKLEDDPAVKALIEAAVEEATRTAKENAQLMCAKMREVATNLKQTSENLTAANKQLVSYETLILEKDNRIKALESSQIKYDSIESQLQKEKEKSLVLEGRLLHTQNELQRERATRSSVDNQVVSTMDERFQREREEYQKRIVSLEVQLVQIKTQSSFANPTPAATSSSASSSSSSSSASSSFAVPTRRQSAIPTFSVNAPSNAPSLASTSSSSTRQGQTRKSAPYNPFEDGEVDEDLQFEVDPNAAKMLLGNASEETVRRSFQRIQYEQPQQERPRGGKYMSMAPQRHPVSTQKQLENTRFSLSVHPSSTSSSSSSSVSSKTSGMAPPSRVPGLEGRRHTLAAGVNPTMSSPRQIRLRITGLPSNTDDRKLLSMTKRYFSFGKILSMKTEFDASFGSRTAIIECTSQADAKVVCSIFGSKPGMTASLL